MEQKPDVNQYFLTLVMMLASAAWQQLGKVANPISGKTEKDLKSAQVTIDILTTLEEKTKGNLTKEEEKSLSAVVSDLKMNYADEAGKGEPEKPVN